MKKSKLLFSLALLFALNVSLFAQDDEYSLFKEERNRNYLKFKDKTESEYNSFQDSVNKEFASHISKTWKEYSLFLGMEPEDEPKPKTLPVAEEDVVLDGKNELEVEKVIENEAMETPEPTPTPSPSPAPSSALIQTDAVVFSVDFYDSKISLDKVCDFANVKLSGTDEKSVSELWSALSSDNYSHMAYQIRDIAERQNINDYGIYLLISQTAQTMFPDRPDEQLVYTVFMLNQLGYKTKIARSENELIALMAVRQLVYKRSYLTYGSEKFYVFTAKPSEIKSLTSIYTYNDLMGNCDKTIDLCFYKPLMLGNKVKTVTLMTEDAGEMNIKINLEDIDFYGSYPHTEMYVYANAEMCDEINDVLLGTLKEHIKGMSSVEAANYLLDFIYATCEYKTDGDQFGYEKPMFCEETLYYPYSDCEDNSILFSYLVRKLLGLDVVLLDYPGHIATAVKFPEEVDGSYLNLEDGAYTVCDPTYYGASVGMSMPQYQNVKLSVIELNKLKRY